ncbi:hypothetical protein [Cupriavidus sp. TMH.W2]|uniref:hypothetical protein n=1 Tax=Cupriavidus sp. TMH.W2 TaxID=3434465 RepID=UPI003D76D0D7
MAISTSSDEMFPRILLKEGEHAGLALLPEDFAAESGALLCSLFGRDTALYSHLRICGFGPLDSFVTVFGHRFIAHPDTLACAAAAWETSQEYKRQVSEISDTVAYSDMAEEWATRCGEISSITRSHLMGLRVSMAKLADSGIEPVVFDEYWADSRARGAAAVFDARREACEREKRTAISMGNNYRGEPSAATAVQPSGRMYLTPDGRVTDDPGDPRTQPQSIGY